MVTTTHQYNLPHLYPNPTNYPYPYPTPSPTHSVVAYKRRKPGKPPPPRPWREGLLAPLPPGGNMPGRSAVVHTHTHACNETPKPRPVYPPQLPEHVSTCHAHTHVARAHATDAPGAVDLSIAVNCLNMSKRADKLVSSLQYPSDAEGPLTHTHTHTQIHIHTHMPAKLAHMHTLTRVSAHVRTRARARTRTRTRTRARTPTLECAHDLSPSPAL